jgi:hypothetical protein
MIETKHTPIYCVTKQPIGSLPGGYTNGAIISVHLDQSVI